jgi:hypothetical protein
MAVDHVHHQQQRCRRAINGSDGGQKRAIYCAKWSVFSGEVLNVLNFRLLALPARRIHDAHVDGQLDFDQARIDSGLSTFFNRFHLLIHRL